MDEQIFTEFIGREIKEIDHLCPCIIFSGDLSLTIECAWRLTFDKTIIMGSYEYDHEKSHQKSFDSLISLLLGKVVYAMKSLPPLSDLYIEFKDGFILEIFCNSSTYENWMIWKAGAPVLIAPPGGNIGI